VPSATGVSLVPLVEWDERRDQHEHEEAAELELLCGRAGPTGSLTELRTELDRREAYLGALRDRGTLGIREVREAIAQYRGETAPRVVRGDPTE